jgi:hypothetical protein
MKMLIETLMLSATTAFAQNTDSVSQRPRFDPAAHLEAYVYADSTSDNYAYDLQR